MNPLRSLIDRLSPRGEVLQIRLVRRGEVVAALYSDDTREFRSPLFGRQDADPEDPETVVPPSLKDVE